ncbi:MAG TPA: hypothetical protein VFZ53_30015 [Polyangiaceae bacterium]
MNASSTAVSLAEPAGGPAASPSAATPGAGTPRIVSDCLPYGETVVLRGNVVRPASAPASPPPTQKRKAGAPPAKPAWTFELEAARCVVDLRHGKNPAKHPVSSLLLMPIAGATDVPPTVDGRVVEATGVLVGIVSGENLHVLYVVRELTTASPVGTP